MTHRNSQPLTSKCKRDTKYFLKWCEHFKLNYILLFIVIILMTIILTAKIQGDIVVCQNENYTDYKIEQMVEDYNYRESLEVIKDAEISYYTNSPDETNADNCHTADMTWICPTTENIVANNGLPFDTIVEIDGVEYRVADRMNRRYGKENFDILVQDKQTAYDLGRQFIDVVVK